VKLEVKEIDDNYTWLYNENQYLYLELSDDSYPRHPIPKSVVSHSFGSIDIRVPYYRTSLLILYGHIYTNNRIITDKLIYFQ